LATAGGTAGSVANGDQDPPLEENGAWDVFVGEAPVFGIRRDVTRIEELRLPARNWTRA